MESLARVPRYSERTAVRREARRLVRLVCGEANGAVKLTFSYILIHVTALLRQIQATNTFGAEIFEKHHLEWSALQFKSINVAPGLPAPSYALCELRVWHWWAG